MELRFDFASDDTTAGFRLAYLESYNWGTYNKTIIKLPLDGANGLLTGDIGSGKSTLVDALTTLLVPHQKIIYNKAAGANTKERTLYSYVVGEYKSAQDENFGYSKAIALRDSSNFTVLLARFENTGFAESLTIAQFFYIADNQVNKFFVVSQNNLSIQKDFFHFSDIRELKKRVRNLPNTNVYDTFKEYEKDFSRTMGIKNEQALNLFYQTVSLKAIGNLTEFIRTHMLESSQIDESIDNLCSSFGDLNHTHELILKAKRQIELLEPIKNESKRYEIIENELANLEEMSDFLGVYLASYKKELLEAKLKELGIELIKNNSNKNNLQNELDNLKETITNLKIELRNNGGDRLSQIATKEKQTSQLLQIRKEENIIYNDLVKSLGLSAVSNEHRFLTTKEELVMQHNFLDTETTKLENALMYDNNSLINYKKEKEELDLEIVYLQNHPSNIPSHISKIREEMAKNLGLSREKLPFVGELISVVDEEWSGAIERVLHNFALSLIVESSLYDKVSNYVENTNLKGKLVYLKVDSKAKVENFENTVANSMVEKLELKVDSPFFGWLMGELGNRFNLSCVKSMEEFRRYKKALSINGQFKSDFVRHEKDDRFDIKESSRWILGWNNLQKLQQFQAKERKLQEKIEHLQVKIETTKKEKLSINTKKTILIQVSTYNDFEKINWYKYSKELENLQKEKEELEISSDVIQSLQTSIIENEKIEKEKELSKERVVGEIAKLETSTEEKQEELNNANLTLANKEILPNMRQQLDGLKSGFIDTKLNLISIGTLKNRFEEYITSGIKKANENKNKSATKIIQSMGEYINNYKEESKELDASIASIGEFHKKLESLKKDNLPKWQKKFKELLKEKTIQGVVFLQSTLEEQSKEILKKIEMINLSLKDIEYSEGTFIELIADKSNNAEIKQFKQDLKSATTGAISEDNNYDEQKFLQIKALIDRFNGRDGYIDVDKKWRKTVSDVRNWFEFSASERYLSDGTQKEYYAHSGGKSGGQKEKLAYTVLASSLAYQFGLEYEKIQSRSFRFVMIDEAFGRGSDESTRYGLKLFEKLKLQLLVITPKQKINVIEPFVQSVHFVHNHDGMNSSLVSMKIEEYQKNKVLA